MHLSSFLTLPALFSYGLESLIVLIISGIFFSIVSVVTYGIYYLCQKNLERKTVFNTLITLSVSMMVTQVIGMMIWLTTVSHHLVKEADDWISFLTFRPLHWDYVFAGLTQTYHEPLSPLITTGQVSNLYLGFALVLIVLGNGIPTLLLWKKTPKFEVLLTAFVFVMIQLLWLGVLAMIQF